MKDGWAHSEATEAVLDHGPTAATRPGLSMRGH